jgi:hypothetical protein
VGIGRFFACAAIVVLAMACDRPSNDRPQAPETHPASSALEDLGSVDAFRARFDADSAHPRLVLLLSPT